MQVSPKTRRLLVIAAAVAAVGGVALVFVVGAERVEEAAKTEGPVFQGILAPGDTRQASLEGIAAQLDAALDRMNRLEGRLDEQDRRREQQIVGEVQRLRRDVADSDAATRTVLEARIKELEGRTSGESGSAPPAADDPLASDVFPPPGAAGPAGPSAPRAARPPASAAPAAPAVYRADPVAEPAAAEAAPATPEERVLRIFSGAPAPAIQERVGGQAAAQPGAQAGAQPGSAIRLIAAEAPEASRARARAGGSEVQLPAGSILTGVLLNGIDAPGGQESSRDPLPVLVRIKHEAILPNRFQANVRECFVLLSAHGELAAERAYMRGEELSCIMTDGTVVQEKLKAYAVGEDGKAGVRGTVVSKQGRLIAAAITIGALDAAAAAVNRAATVSVGVGTAGAAGGSDILSGAFSAGATSALDRIAEWYLDQADKLFPVVEVAPGRRIDVILTTGMSFRLDLG